MLAFEPKWLIKSIGKTGTGIRFKLAVTDGETPSDETYALPFLAVLWIAARGRPALSEAGATETLSRVAPQQSDYLGQSI